MGENTENNKQMKKIKLINGTYAIVDDEDFPYLNRFRWIYLKGVFATLPKNPNEINNTNRYVSVNMAYFLIKPKSPLQVKHINGNGLDFRKKNLLLVREGKKTHMGRKRISHFGKKPTSPYKGIIFRTGRRRPYSARIDFNKQTFYLGCFYQEKDAASAYNDKAKELYGKFAYQNKI